MKHGIAFRKFSRTSSHRMLMLRNLVSSLFEHEQIKTTLPKARDTARLAEKIITLGKKGDRPAYTRASAFLLLPNVLSKVFGTFAKRYEDRPGGYTRIHKFGNRQGDNAPHAILELVDNPRDLRFEMTARAIGRELLKHNLKTEKPTTLINHGMPDAQKVVLAERSLGFQQAGVLRPKTRWNLQKVLRFRSQAAPIDVIHKAENYADELLASPVAFQAILDEKKTTAREIKRRMVEQRAGQALPGDTRSALDIARGALGYTRKYKKEQVLTTKSIFK